MIDALIAGKLQGAPAQRVGKSGKPFTTAKVRAAAGEGESMFVNVIAFSATAGAALMALGDGDSVALAGSVTIKIWTDREGKPHPSLDIVAGQVLTAYHVTRKRKAVASEPEQSSQPRQTGDCQNFDDRRSDPSDMDF